MCLSVARQCNLCRIFVFPKSRLSFWKRWWEIEVSEKILNYGKMTTELFEKSVENSWFINAEWCTFCVFSSWPWVFAHRARCRRRMSLMKTRIRQTPLACGRCNTLEKVWNLQSFRAFFQPLLLFFPIPSLSTVSLVNCTRGLLARSSLVSSRAVIVIVSVVSVVTFVVDPPADIFLLKFSGNFKKKRKKFTWTVKSKL